MFVTQGELKLCKNFILLELSWTIYSQLVDFYITLEG